MRLSKRGEYGLRAMIDLASWSGDRKAIQLKEIADRENIPIKFLEQIMLSLKNAGLVNSRMGVNGGYYLSQPVESDHPWADYPDFGWSTGSNPLCQPDCIRTM